MSAQTQGNGLGAAGLALFASTTTLVCCALPALLVSLGLGFVMAGVFTAVPQLAWLGQHKTWVFGGAGVMLALSGGLLWHARSLPCPIDPVKAAACGRLRRLSWGVWGASVALYAVAGFFAFLAADLFFPK
jgi:hypothetical protein